MTKPEGAYHHGNLRSALIAAALELIEGSGIGELSLRAVARRAGVSTAAPYRHFPSREALLAAVAEEGFRSLAAEIQTATAEVTEPLARLGEAGVAFVRFAAAHPAHYSVMGSPGLFDGARYPGVAAVAESTLALLLHAIRDCQRAGAVRDGDPHLLALVAWSGVHGLASLIGTGQLDALNLPSSAVEPLARWVTQVLLAGLGTTPGATP